LSTGAAPVAGTCTATPTYSALVGRSVTAQAVDALGYLYVCADGTAGTSTVSIAITNAAGVTAVLSTKTVTFFGKVTKLAVSSTVYTIGKSGGAATGASTAANLRDRSDVNIPAFVVKMTDSADRVANAAAEPTIVSSDVTVVASGLCGLDDGLDAVYSSGGTGYYNCGFTTASSAKSGDKATLTIRVLDPSDPLGVAYLTTTIAVTVGGSIATETLAFDKASYAPGEAMVITRTAKDSAGNPVFDGAASPEIKFSKAVGGTAPVASKYVGGVSASATSVAKSGVFAPVTPGAFSALATSGNAAGSAITAASAVGANSELAALTTLVNSLIAKINALNKLVIKIQKKVRA
jgi:hypothetical protein